MSLPIFYYQVATSKMFDEDYYLYLDNDYCLHYNFYLKGLYGSLSFRKNEKEIFCLEMDSGDNDLFTFLVKLKMCKDLSNEQIDFIIDCRKKFIETKGHLLPRRISGQILDFTFFKNCDNIDNVLDKLVRE